MAQEGETKSRYIEDVDGVEACLRDGVERERQVGVKEGGAERMKRDEDDREDGGESAVCEVRMGPGTKGRSPGGSLNIHCSI